MPNFWEAEEPYSGVVSLASINFEPILRRGQVAEEST
jgi:hypothetical protein